MNHRTLRGLAWVAVALGAVEFIFRAIVRARSNWLSDLSVPYISARLGLEGANPYDPSTSLQTWFASGAPPLSPGSPSVAPFSVYPPPTLLLMVPLALMRWGAAYHAFFLIGLLLYTSVVYGLVRLGWPEHRSLYRLMQEPAAMFFVAFSLGFAPIHTAFNSMNIVLFSCCAAVLAVLLYARSVDPAIVAASAAVSNQQKTSRPLATGLLVGIGTTVAICLKPTTGIFLLPWLIRERRWRWIVSVIAACVAITAISLAPLIAHQGLSWLPDYRRNVTSLFTLGGNADVSRLNRENTDRIDLQLIAFAAFGNRTLASAVAGTIYFSLLLAFLRRAGWRSDAASWNFRSKALDLPLLVASGCLALGLLPSYTRVYAAIVLLPLVLWCFRHLRFRSAQWLLLLLSDFLINSSAIVRLVGEGTGMIALHHRFWDLTIGGHTCWLLLAIGCLLLYAIHQQIGEDVRMSPVD